MRHVFGCSKFELYRWRQNANEIFEILYRRVMNETNETKRKREDKSNASRPMRKQMNAVVVEIGEKRNNRAIEFN